MEKKSIKEITEEEAKVIASENAGKTVVIKDETNNKWYDIREVPMEEVSGQLMEILNKDNGKGNDTEEQ